MARTSETLTNSKSVGRDSAAQQPLISIITVVRNAQRQMAITLASVVNQTYKNVEYIVIDGGSTDGTESLIRDNVKHISAWVSEPDNGIYDAMNKGVRFSSGDYLYFLNSGDCFSDINTLENVAECLSTTSPEILYGRVLVNNEGVLGDASVKITTEYELYRETVCHQAIFASKRVFEKSGSFNTSYKICGDKEWLLRALKVHNCELSYIDLPICVFDNSGVSSRQRIRLRLEQIKMNRVYFKRTLYRFFLKQLWNLTLRTFRIRCTDRKAGES